MPKSPLILPSRGLFGFLNLTRGDRRPVKPGPVVVQASNLGSGPNTDKPPHDANYPVFVSETNAPTLTKLQRTAAVADPAVSVTMYVSARMWARLCQELRSLPPVLWDDPSNLPSPANFQALALTKNFTVRNAGTDDLAAIDERNEAAARLASWRDRYDRFALRPGTLKNDAVDARSTWK